MYKLISIIFTLFISTNIFSQKILVLDLLNKQPVSYSNYYCKSNGQVVQSGYCNEKGYVFLPQNLNFQTIDFSCIGYESQIINRENLNHIVYLKRNTITLQELIIKRSDSKSLQLLGYSNLRKKASLSATKGTEICVFIENPYNENRTIDSFIFKIKNKGNLKIGIRIHLYSKDSLDLKPYKELLTENIVHKIDNNKSIVEINVKEKSIVFPKEGCFLGIEWIGILNEESIEFNDDLDNWNNAFVELNDNLSSAETFFRNGLNSSQIWEDMHDFKKQVEFYSHFKNYPNASFGIKVFN